MNEYLGVRSGPFRCAMSEVVSEESFFPFGNHVSEATLHVGARTCLKVGAQSRCIRLFDHSVNMWAKIQTRNRSGKKCAENISIAFEPSASCMMSFSRREVWNDVTEVHCHCSCYLISTYRLEFINDSDASMNTEFYVDLFQGPRTPEQIHQFSVAWSLCLENTCAVRRS